GHERAAHGEEIGVHHDRRAHAHDQKLGSGTGPPSKSLMRDSCCVKSVLAHHPGSPSHRVPASPRLPVPCTLASLIVDPATPHEAHLDHDERADDEEEE